MHKFPFSPLLLYGYSGSQYSACFSGFFRIFLFPLIFFPLSTLFPSISLRINRTSLHLIATGSRAQCDFCPLLGSVNELLACFDSQSCMQYEDKGPV